MIADIAFVTYDECNPDTQAECWRVLPDSLAAVYGLAEARRMVNELREAVRLRGWRAVCREISERERQYFGDRAQDDLTTVERGRHRMTFAAWRAAARYLDSVLPLPLVAF